MGCGGSKLDNLQPVVLCRDRSKFLAEAIRYRYVLAEAHHAYVSSLRSVGESLLHFFAPAEVVEPDSPVLKLPKTGKGVAFPPSSPVSRYGSHMHLCSEEGDSESDDGYLHPEGFLDLNRGADVNSYFHYARKDPPAYVVGVERAPLCGGAEVGNLLVGSFRGDSGGPSSFFDDSYSGYYQSHQSSDDYCRKDEVHGQFGFGRPHTSDFREVGNGFSGLQDSASNGVPPPPPSPPRAFTWDFLNPFETFENYYRPYTPSRSSREVREEEGIPELEDDMHEEIVKEAYLGERCRNYGVGGSSSSHGGKTPLQRITAPSNKNNGQQMHDKGVTVNGGENLPVDRHLVSNGVQHSHLEKGSSRNLLAGSMSVPTVLEKIKAQFENASISCEDMSRMLEVGKGRKVPYHLRRYEVVSSKMMNAISTSLPSANIWIPSGSKGGQCSKKDVSFHLEDEEAKCTESRNLSTTLEKLYIWEKKLHEEVKAEEKLRMLHDKKRKQLERLDFTGAEAQKVDATRTAINKLSTKIKIGLQVIKSISNRISKLRDEELLPLLLELIQGSFKMWQAILKCHGNQLRATLEARALDAVILESDGKLTDAQMECTLQLAMRLLNWIETFSCWIDATKNYVKSLNRWLQKCLNCEPEITPDGITHSSPKRLGAPPIFVICNSWSRAMDGISEREVVEAMQDFTAGILHIWQKHYAERRKHLSTDKDMDGMMKALVDEDQKIHKAVDTVRKRCSRLYSLPHHQFGGEIIRLSHMGEAKNLHTGLKRLFEVMEKFAASSVEVYLKL